MSKVILNIKTDAETKAELQAFAAEIGMPVSVMLHAQIKQLLRDRKFNLSVGLQPTPYLENIMREVEEDLKSNQKISGPNQSAQEMFDHLDTD